MAKLKDSNVVANLFAEENDNYSNDNLFNITSWGADISLRELITSFTDGDIIKPELQRKYVWDKSEASRFIESILLGLPVPSIFLATAQEDRRLIVDGYQRINTICDFYAGVWSKDGSSFRLTNNEKINVRWRNKLYTELSPEDQRRFRQYTIHAIIFEQKHPRNDDGLYQIFERINTSGKTLNPQEIRNCVYQGKLNSLLFELNQYPRWRELFGELNENSRMLDLEYILRFFALSQDSILQSSSGAISLKRVLNEYMGFNRDAVDEVIEALRSEFLQCVDFIYESFGIDAFCNLKGDLSSIRKKFYPTVYDSIIIATSIALKRGFQSSNTLKDQRLDLLRDPNYRESITQGTMRLEAIHNRINKALTYLYGMTL